MAAQYTTTKFSYTMLLLLVCTVYVVTAQQHNSKKTNIKEFPQNYSTHTSPKVRGRWEGIRVFADTSLLMADPEACDKVGKYVRVGAPGGTVGHPLCSDIISNNCWQLCSEADLITPEKAKDIRAILKPIVAWLNAAIKVRPVHGNIRIPKTFACADNLVLPNYYGTIGIPNSDLALVVTGRPTLGTTVAWATECAADQSGRPVFGHINIGPGELDDFEGHKDYIFKVILHELIHVLGFNSYKFPFYKDLNGKPYASVTKTFLEDGKKIIKIVTPHVLSAAREHFGCDEMDGVPLEDGGDHSTSDSHWEKRIFRNEFMTGSSDKTAIISKITLALFEDMGWYGVDYSQAEDFEWGRGMGCAFVNGKCSGWKQKQGYFCSKPGEQKCTSDRTAMGYCNLIQHKNQLPTTSQYFSDPFSGGSDELSDFCPHIVAYANGVCTDTTNQQATPLFGEHFGEDSKCFESSLVKEGFREKEAPAPMCYDHRCVGDEEEEEDGEGEKVELEVLVGTTWYKCPFGQRLEGVAGFTGSLLCPEASFCKGGAKEHARRIDIQRLEREASGGSALACSGILVFLSILLTLLYF